mgnify:CR=1 FL=1
MEALANPDRGWFYRRSADTFSAIPGSPIAYWVSDKIYSAFARQRVKDIADCKIGVQTGNNELFCRFWHEVRFWYEVEFEKIYGVTESGEKWYPYTKGEALESGMETTIF